MAARLTAPSVEELEQRAKESRIEGIAIVTDEERFALFDDAVREQMKLSGEEFIKR